MDGQDADAVCAVVHMDEIDVAGREEAAPRHEVDHAVLVLVEQRAGEGHGQAKDDKYKYRQGKSTRL